MEKKQILILIGLLFFPIAIFAGGLPETSYAKAVSFMQGDGILEEWYTNGFITNLQTFAEDHYDKYVLFAQGIGGITGLIYMANKGWEFLSGDKPWDVMPLLRPLVFALVIANWSPLVKGIQIPFRALENTAKEEVRTMQTQLLSERIERFGYQHKLVDAIIQAKTDTKLAEEAIKTETTTGGGSGFWNPIGGAIDDMASYIMAMGLRLQFDMQLLVANLLEIIGLFILRLVAYGMLFVQQIMIFFLIVIGPISFGFSILPAFRNAWVGWFSKFIGVQFYGVITYVIMQMGIMMMLTSVGGELNRYKQLIDETGGIKSLELVIAFAESGVMTFGMLILSYVLTAVGILMVPTLSSYILGSASSTSGATSKMGSLAGVAVGKMM